MTLLESVLARARLFDVSFAWAAGCAVLHVVAASVLRPARFARLARLSGSQMMSLHNQVVAATHAMILFVAAVQHLAPRVSPSEAGVLLLPIRSVSPMEPVEAFWCCAMVGYLLYDMVVVIHGREGFDMLAHHAMGLASWGSLRVFDHGGIFIMWVHLAEVRRFYILARARTLTPAHRAPRRGCTSAPRCTSWGSTIRGCSSCPASSRWRCSR
jgi:hypothetical protein